jgi:hypothetical protein
MHEGFGKPQNEAARGLGHATRDRCLGRWCSHSRGHSAVGDGWTVFLSYGLRCRVGLSAQCNTELDGGHQKGKATIKRRTVLSLALTEGSSVLDTFSWAIGYWPLSEATGPF